MIYLNQSYNLVFQDRLRSIVPRELLITLVPKFSSESTVVDKGLKIFKWYSFFKNNLCLDKLFKWL